MVSLQGKIDYREITRKRLVSAVSVMFAAHSSCWSGAACGCRVLECDDGERIRRGCWSIFVPIDLVHSPLVTVVGRVTALLPLVTTCDHRRCATIKHDSMTHPLHTALHCTACPPSRLCHLCSVDQRAVKMSEGQ